MPIEHTFADEPITPNTLTAWFRELPGVRAIVQKARDEVTAAVLDERRQAVAAIARLRAEDADALARQARRIQPLLVREAQLEKQLATVRDERLGLEADHRSERFTTSQAIDRYCARLDATAPREAIEKFAADMRELLEAHRLQADAVTERAIDGKDYQRWSNRDSLIRRSEAITAAVLAARALKSEALDEAALQARLDQLRATIPPISPRPGEYCR